MYTYMHTYKEGRDDVRVSEVEEGLEEARHLGLAEEVIDGVQEYVAGRGPRGEEGHPLWFVSVCMCVGQWCVVQSI